MPQRSLNLEQAAAYLHLDAQDLQRLVRAGDLAAEFQGGRPVFLRGELDAWASQRILRMGARRLDDYHGTASARTRHSNGSHVQVADLLAGSRVSEALPARTKAAVLRELVALAESDGLLYDPADLVRSLEAREGLCSTGLPGGVALVHPRHHDPYLATASFLALGRTPRPIPFGSPDGEPTDLFFLICCQEERLHLHALARLCAMIQTTTLLPALRGAPGTAELLAAVTAAEAEVVGRLR